MIETVDDIVEQLADWCGVYGSHTEADECECRMCWTMSLKVRIESAVQTQARLEAGARVIAAEKGAR